MCWVKQITQKPTINYNVLKSCPWHGMLISLNSGFCYVEILRAGEIIPAVSSQSPGESALDLTVHYTAFTLNGDMSLSVSCG